MNLQDVINNAAQAQRAERLKNSDQMTLGELIAKLEGVQFESEKPPTVVYDFEYLFPNAIDSWRGSYSELALNYVSEGEEMKLPAFMEMLRACIGKTFEGYKGGDYLMGKTTPLWVANYGRSGSTAIVGVLDLGYQIVLLTAYREF